MSAINSSNKDIKIVNEIQKHPKFSKVMKLMKNESIQTVESLLIEVISSCRASSKVL